jgi:hypothetical protein
MHGIPHKGEANVLDEALLELLRPLVRDLVREEVERAKLGLRWVPVKKAAEQLGLSEAALRQRVKAGTVPGKNVEGRVYVDMLEHDRRIDRLR